MGWFFFVCLFFFPFLYFLEEMLVNIKLRRNSLTALRKAEITGCDLEQCAVPYLSATAASGGVDQASQAVLVFFYSRNCFYKHWLGVLNNFLNIYTHIYMCSVCISAEVIVQISQ